MQSVPGIIAVVSIVFSRRSDQGIVRIAGTVDSGFNYSTHDAFNTSDYEGVCPKRGASRNGEIVSLGDDRCRVPDFEAGFIINLLDILLQPD